MVISVLLPLLMVIHVLDPVLKWISTVYTVLNIFASVCQMGGFLLGIASVAFIIKRKKKE